ncbi:YbhB/YbcL family Raf kinase inhibitor-like protein [Elusimicrobiota bacterium]
MKLQTIILLGSVIFISSCNGQIKNKSQKPSPKAKTIENNTLKEVSVPFHLTSTAFKHDAKIPKKYTCDGEDVSPDITWRDVPKGTKSIALIMDDPDAPPGIWVHWIIYNIPADQPGLTEGIKKNEALDNGAKQGLVWGVNEFSKVGYWGPCPPPGKPHRYFFKAYALNTMLDLPAKATVGELVRAMGDHTLAQTEFIGLYKR